MEYIGKELELFQHATNWKRYVAKVFAPFIRGRVLEVGAGLGVNAKYLWNDKVSQYTFLEPDGALLVHVPQHLEAALLERSECIQGTSADIGERRFDTIMYLDVIEHIADHEAELERALELLVPGGHLLILVPAHPALYSDFDRAIGHHRRYDKETLKAILPSAMELIQLRYMDLVGALLSLGNKWFLRSSQPTLEQVLFWDRRIVPVSRVLDPLLFHASGRSLVAIAKRPERD